MGEIILFYFIMVILIYLTLFNYLTMVTFGTYFLLHFTPLQFVFLEGEGVRIPATSYLVPLFTLIYIVLFHLLPPYYLDVPCYLNNRQRYCSVWSEREGLFTLNSHQNTMPNDDNIIYCENIVSR